MVSGRLTFVALVALVILPALPGCGDSEEQVALRAYSRWVEQKHAEQKELLLPMERDRAALVSFVSDLPSLLERGNLPQILQGAKAVRPGLDAIRDEVRPAHETFRREVDDRRCEHASIGKVHERFSRAVELRSRGLAALARVADLVDQLAEIDPEAKEPGAEERLQETATSVQKVFGEVGGVFERTNEAIDREWARVVGVLEPGGESTAALRARAKNLVAEQAGLYMGFLAQLDQSQGLAGLRPILSVVEQRLVPDFDRLARSAGDLEMPPGVARDAWSGIAKSIAERATALKKLPPLLPSIETCVELADRLPGTRAFALAEQLLQRFPGVQDDLMQAGEGYGRFTDELARLRAEIL